MERHHQMASMGELLRERNIVLKGADVLSAQGFTQVPNHVLKSSKLSPGAKLAYAMLLSYAWQNDYCFPGQERLAKDMGAGLRSVVRFIQELEKEEFVVIKRRGQGKPPGQGTSFFAHHKPPEVAWPGAGAVRGGDHGNGRRRDQADAP